MNWLAAFGVMFALDFIWAKYTAYIVAQRPYAAGFAAALIMVCNGVVTLIYVQDPSMLIPAALGAFTGTAAAVLAHGFNWRDVTFPPLKGSKRIPASTALTASAPTNSAGMAKREPEPTA